MQFGEDCPRRATQGHAAAPMDAGPKVPQDGRSPCRDGVTWEAGNANMTECVTVNVHIRYSRAPFPPLRSAEDRLTFTAPRDMLQLQPARGTRENAQDPPFGHGGLPTLSTCDLYRQVNWTSAAWLWLWLRVGLWPWLLIRPLGRACTHLHLVSQVGRRRVGCLGATCPPGVASASRC